jgi:hypothetical protein
MIQPWIGIALLGVSWLLGLTYYEMANPWAQGIVLAIGAWMLSYGERANPFRATRKAYPELTVAILVLLLPVAWWSPWPYRLAPLAIIAGLLLERAAMVRRVAAVLVMGGVILLAQVVALTIYSAATGRSHDLPGACTRLFAELCRLVGIDAAGDGPTLVVAAARQSHRLALSWDIVFDPATLMFLVGGLAWITIDAGRRPSARLRWSEWGWTLGRFALVVLAWLPIRAVLLVALYVHRAGVTETDQTLHVMNQFFSPWVLLGMLAPPVILAWRWVPRAAGLLSLRPDPDVPSAENGMTGSPEPKRAAFKRGSGSLSVQYLAAAVCCLFGAILIALGWQCEPIGAKKQGRVMFVEKHSPWSPSNVPFNTDVLGGGDDEHGTSYNYAAASRYLGQYYDVSALTESQAIDEQTLSGCDVLVIKIPKFRYEPQEVQAVVDFVNRGGGLLLIGDHTNLDCSAAHMNDISRAFGFTFRDDVLFSSQPAPDDERYTAPKVPHPAIEHVPQFDFAVSCSIDPGFSRGRPVVEETGLWSMPGYYHASNFMPYAEHTPEIRFGSFVQAWSTHGGRGRVIAWGDSTIFSNFCLYQPGKAEVLLNLVDWLNHEGGMDLAWLWILFGLAAIFNGLWLVRRDGSAWLVLVAATSCGWVVGSTVTAALLVRQMPLPTPREGCGLPVVVIDRTTSQVPLATGAFNDDREMGRGFGLLEQSIARLGYKTARAEGNGVFQPNATIVMILPTRPATDEFRDRLVRFVEEGGRLLVIDAGLSEVPSTSNQILRPFGLSLDYNQPWNGELVKPAAKPEAANSARAPEDEASYPAGINIDSAWQVIGGTSLATVHVNMGQLDPKAGAVYEDRSICAVARHGQGQVMVVSFGNMFTDRNLANYWSVTPNPTERARYDLFFSLMQRLVEDKPIVVPNRTTTAPGPSIKPPPTKPAEAKPAPLRPK